VNVAAAATAGLEHYTALAPTKKLALLVCMIDAASETEAASKAANEVYKEREQLEDEFEREDRDLKRKTRSEREEVRVLVRQRLIKELQAREVRGEAAEGEEVNEAQVQTEMVRLSEAETCLHPEPQPPDRPSLLVERRGELKLSVLTKQELLTREYTLCNELELAGAGIDAMGNELSKRKLEASNARRDELRHRRDHLHKAREDSVAQLAEAVAAPSVAKLQSALQAAREARLEGDSAQDGVCGDKGGRWVTTEVRAAWCCRS